MVVQVWKCLAEILIIALCWVDVGECAFVLAKHAVWTVLEFVGGLLEGGLVLAVEGVELALVLGWCVWEKHLEVKLDVVIL